MKYRKALLLLCLIVTVQLFAQDNNLATPQKMKWFQDDKFGLFLHWGLYSQAAGMWNGKPYRGQEHFMLYEKIPWKIYRDSLATKFNPAKFNADDWVHVAKSAGMKYIVITTKHHDGFAMFNSPSSDYNIVAQTPYAKDPMRDLAQACRRHGIKLCFYYSLGRDWQDPDVPTNWPVKAGRSNTWDFPNEDAKDLNKYIDRKVLPQLKELLTQYGPIGVIWFDTPELFTPAQSKKIREYILSLQPQCIINSRVGNGMGDFLVREQQIGDRYKLPWESNITISRNWGYNRFDTLWKSPELLVRQLTEIVSKGGNYLLNVGPRPDGFLPEQATGRLKQIGVWMGRNGEAIYGTRPWNTDQETDDKTREIIRFDSSKTTTVDAMADHTSKRIFPEVRFTQKNGVVYVFVNSYRVPVVQIKNLSMLSNGKIKKVTALDSGKDVVFLQNREYLEIPLATPSEGINVRVFKVQFEHKKAM